jgi:hypothetical protein
MRINEVPQRPADLLFPGRQEAIARALCIPAPIGCGGPADEFSDDLSRREFRISGLCQSCQDAIFGEDEDDV